MLNMRASRRLVTGDALSNPVLDPSLGIFDISVLGEAPNDAFETHAGRYVDAAARIEERLVFAVAQNQNILGVIERECFGDAFDRHRQSPAAFTNLTLVRLLKLDR